MPGARPMNPSSAWMLAPSERHAEALVIAGASASSLPAWLNELASERAPDLTATTPEIRRLLTARLLGLHSSRARGVDDALGALRRARTRTSSLRATNTERGAWLAKTLEAADAELRLRQLRDDRDGTWLAAELLKSEPERVRARGRELKLVGFTRWDRATLTLFETLHAALGATGGGASIELPLPSEGPLADACGQVFAELEARWATRPTAPALLPQRERRQGTPRLIAAHDAPSEARAVVRAVLEALQGGAALDAIAIAPVELSESVLEPLRFELEKARLPFVEPRGRPPLASPRAHRALELLRLAAGPLSRDALIDVLRTPGLKLGRWFSDTNPSELCSELAKLPLRVDRTGDELLRDLGDRLAELEREERPSASRLRPAERALAAFLAELAAVGEPAPRTLHARRAAKLFDELGLSEPALPVIRDAIARSVQKRPELLFALGQDSRANRAIQAALERTRAAALALGATEAVALEVYVGELDQALEGSTPLSGAARAGAVRIARPVDLAGLELDAVVLCRASDAALDRNPAPNAVLGERFGALLPKDERPPTVFAEHRFELVAVASVLSGARQLSVSYATHEGESSLGPSRLVMWLESRGALLRREPMSLLARGAGRTIRAPVPSPSALRRAEIEAERQRYFFAADPEAAAGPYSGRTQDLAAYLGGDSGRPIAVTALERALRCRFLGFMGSVLRANRDDPVGDAISARERGSLLHAALAAALDATRSRLGVDTPAELLAAGMEAARVTLETKGRGALRRAGLAATLLDVRAILRVSFAADDGVAFAEAELGFGPGSTWQPLELDSLHVSGRIDRIDASGDRRRVRVIDYKTRLGSKGDGSTELQPWLYAEKVAREWGAEHTSFAYFGLNQRTPALRVVYEGPPNGEEIRTAFERAETIAQELGAGRVEPLPKQKGFCTRCLARDACRRPLSAPDPGPERGEP